MATVIRNTEKQAMDPINGYLEVPILTWYRTTNLRSLYLRMPILMLCATINGYDGSLLNGLQTMVQWQSCK